MKTSTKRVKQHQQQLKESGGKRITLELTAEELQSIKNQANFLRCNITQCIKWMISHY